VVRREHGEMKRYLHLSTGNYNPITSKIYTDFGLFTANEDFCKDASDLFNYLTGFSRQKEYRKFLIAPFGMRKGLINLIDNEIKSHKQNSNGRIIIKSNSLVDDKIIMKLYQASTAGVKVDLIIRGICRIRPGITDLSENISVVSIVGRFLEHTRAYWFYNNGKPVIYTGSADIMQRNFDRRVEMLYPIEHSGIKEDITEILGYYLNDNVKARILDGNGNYTKKEFVSGKLPDSEKSSAKTANLNTQEYLLSKVKKKFLSERKKEYRKKIKKLKQKNRTS
jgi:polyphosphate kinase